MFDNIINRKLCSLKSVSDKKQSGSHVYNFCYKANKKIILSVFAVIAAIMLSCDSNANAAGSLSRQNYTKIIDERGMHVYKFDVKDNSGKNHEILICRTRLSDGGICMLELNTERK